MAQNRNQAAALTYLGKAVKKQGLAPVIQRIANGMRILTQADLYSAGHFYYSVQSDGVRSFFPVPSMLERHYTNRRFAYLCKPIDPCKPCQKNLDFLHCEQLQHTAPSLKAVTLTGDATFKEAELGIVLPLLGTHTTRYAHHGFSVVRVSAAGAMRAVDYVPQKEAAHLLDAALGFNNTDYAFEIQQLTSEQFHSSKLFHTEGVAAFVERLSTQLESHLTNLAARQAFHHNRHSRL